jgi:hypothetical protein
LQLLLADVASLAGRFFLANGNLGRIEGGATLLLVQDRFLVLVCKEGIRREFRTVSAESNLWPVENQFGTADELPR